MRRDLAIGSRVSENTIQPGRIWYLVPLLVTLVSLLFIPLAIVQAVTDKNILAVKFVVPGEKDLEIRKPGKYVLWNETQTIFQGQTYSSSTSIPAGVQIQLTELKTMSSVPMNTDMSATMTSGQEARVSVGYFELIEPGQYRVKVEGQFPPRVFYFRESMLRQLGPIFRAFLLTMTGLVVAVLIAVIIFLKRQAAPRNTPGRY